MSFLPLERARQVREEALNFLDARSDQACEAVSSVAGPYGRDVLGGAIRQIAHETTTNLL